ncbi:hypothetical protein HN937_28250 [Candidatus Poribacteria bacterium]|jgi:hypothetical protein|nr:hypothetical protein [Candidatus Poribacteria bacterium]
MNDATTPDCDTCPLESDACPDCPNNPFSADELSDAELERELAEQAAADVSGDDSVPVLSPGITVAINWTEAGLDFCRLVRCPRDLRPALMRIALARETVAGYSKTDVVIRAGAERLWRGRLDIAHPSSASFTFADVDVLCTLRNQHRRLVAQQADAPFLAPVDELARVIALCEQADDAFEAAAERSAAFGDPDGYIW